MASQNAAPHAEYSRRLEARQELVAQLDRASESVSYVRIALAILSVAAIWLGNYWWLLPAVLFIVAVIYHSRVRQARASADRAAAHYRAGIARIEDRWSGQGNPGTRFDDPHHVYAADLDLFGPGNLFELLSIARTRMGENALASWLVAPAPVATVLERQQSVGELRERVDLREDLAVLGENAGVGVQPEELSDLGGSLRDSVKARIPEAVELAACELAAWGFPPRPRDSRTGVAPLNANALAIDVYENGRPSSEEACRIGDARVLARSRM